MTETAAPPPPPVIRKRPRTLVGNGAPPHLQAGGTPLGRPPRAGDRLGPYHLCLELARGGMATLYLARLDGRAGMHRFVALKCIRPELAADERFIGMFFDEARIASQIYHPNVCSVLDFDEQRGAHYIAMEFLHGQPLAAIRRALGRASESSDGPDPLRRAGLVARILAEAAEGLHAAHELIGRDGLPLHVVHRDVSPENIFVTYDGGVKLLDFGVASAACQQHHTRTGIIKGKYAYLQPEALHGNKADRRADVWGLGVVAWELVTGERLFERASEVETLQAIDKQDIPPPSSRCPGLPPEFDAIVMLALERNPDSRYQTAREFGQECTRFLADNRLAIGMPEVAALMGRLFPGGRAVVQQLLGIADQLETAPIEPRTELRDEDVPIHEGTVIHESSTGQLPAGSRMRRLMPDLRRPLPLAAAAGLVALLVAFAWGRGAAEPVAGAALPAELLPVVPAAAPAGPTVEPAEPPTDRALPLSVDVSALGPELTAELVPVESPEDGTTMMLLRIGPRRVAGETEQAALAGPPVKTRRTAVERRRLRPPVSIRPPRSPIAPL